MKKRYRLLLVAVLMAVGFYFLWPSLKWYFLTPQADKDVAESSRNQIKVYSQDKAEEVLKQILALNPNDTVPAEYGYLIPKAAARYQQAKLPVPSTWTIKDVLNAYPSRSDLASDIEGKYRDQMLALKSLRNQTLQLGLDLRGGMYVVMRADFATLEKENNVTLDAAQRQEKLTQAIDTLRNKVDQYGLSEPSLTQQGSDEIVLQIPGTQDPEKVRSFVQGKGLLTFHIVDTDALPAINQYVQQTGSTLFDAAGTVKDPQVLKLVPAGDQLVARVQKDAYGMNEIAGYTVIKKEVGLNGDQIRSAQVSRDPVTGQPDVVFTLTPQGGETFYQLTSANIGKLLAVVLDNEVVANPATINGAIRDSVQVTGFNAEDAQNLALVLRTGSLPVPLEIISQQAVGASLGEDAIRQGIDASALGLGLVFIFMLLYYRRSGVNAIIAQLLNLYFIVAILSVFNFTLTLTAIAGLVLNVGMAVDASVLIFERMKEEMRLGKTVSAVVKAGFDRAFWAIADSNITTIIAALVLSQLAKGSIQGFAMTLMIGNISTLFTAVFISRLIFDFNVDVLKVKRIVVSWRKIA